MRSNSDFPEVGDSCVDSNMCGCAIAGTLAEIGRWVRYGRSQPLETRVREVNEMRMALTTNMGWLAVPALALIATAYIWVVSALLGREQHPKADIAPVERAA